MVSQKFSCQDAALTVLCFVNKASAMLLLTLVQYTGKSLYFKHFLYLLVCYEHT